MLLGYPTGSQSCDNKIELVPSQPKYCDSLVWGFGPEIFWRPKILKLNVLTIRDVRKFFQLLEILNKTAASVVFSRLTFLNLSLACQLPFHALLIALFCWTFSVQFFPSLCSEHFLILVSQDWEQESTPIVAKGKEPKFIKPSDKFSSTEGENVFCFLEVVGDPIPTVTWFKVHVRIFICFYQCCPIQMSKDLKTEPRCKMWTSGPNTAILGFQKTKQDDEGLCSILDQLLISFENQFQEPIDAKSRTNMGWWSTSSVYMSQVSCFVVDT